MFQYTKDNFFKNPNINMENYYSYIVSSFLFFLCILIHTGLLFLFYFIKVYPMAIFNIFSVSVFIVNLFFNYRGKLQLAYNLAVLEILVHACLATVFIGWDSNFSYYLLVLIAVNIFFSPSNRKSRLIGASFTTLAVGFLNIYCNLNSPIYKINLSVLTIVGFINVLTICLTFIIVCYFYLKATEKLKTDYEFSEMVLNSLGEVTENILNSAHNLEETSSDISTGIKDSTIGMEKIDNSIDNINKYSQDNVISFNEITNVTQEALNQSEIIFKKGSSMKKESEQIMKSVDEGADIILKSVRAIGEVENNSKVILQQIESLKTSSDNIHQSISMITNVTSGIKLLSLNASIEAVNAGEHSKGFFVIAHEIRKLAEQTEEFSKDIGSMLKDFNTKIESLLLSGNQNIEFVTSSVQQTLEVNFKLDTILTAIKSSHQNINDISETSMKHASISSDISTIIEKTSKASYNIASDVEDISKTIKEQLNVLNGIEKVSVHLHTMSEELKSKIVENENVIGATQKSK